VGKLYNEVAGRDISRLAALSDGIFAFAMTLLVLNLRVPDWHTVHSEGELLRALAPVGAPLLTCAITFLTLGIFWVGHQTHLSGFREIDRNGTWLHICFLFTVMLTPFSTALLAAFITYRVAILVYWLNLFLLGLTLFLSYRHAVAGELLKKDLPIHVNALFRRIIVAQGLYAIAALLCFVNTWLSIGLTFAIQLNYAFAPRIPWLYRY
jgi:uncharacterized membrane protein